MEVQVIEYFQAAGRRPIHDYIAGSEFNQLPVVQPRKVLHGVTIGFPWR